MALNDKQYDAINMWTRPIARDVGLDHNHLYRFVANFCSLEPERRQLAIIAMQDLRLLSEAAARRHKAAPRVAVPLVDNREAGRWKARRDTVANGEVVTNGIPGEAVYRDFHFASKEERQRWCAVWSGEPDIYFSLSAARTAESRAQASAAATAQNARQRQAAASAVGSGGEPQHAAEAPGASEPRDEAALADEEDAQLEAQLRAGYERLVANVGQELADAQVLESLRDLAVKLRSEGHTDDADTLERNLDGYVAKRAQQKPEGEQ
jgi:hypothetical protein